MLTVIGHKRPRSPQAPRLPSLQLLAADALLQNVEQEDPEAFEGYIFGNAARQAHLSRRLVKRRKHTSDDIADNDFLEYMSFGSERLRCMAPSLLFFKNVPFRVRGALRELYKRVAKHVRKSANATWRGCQLGRTDATGFYISFSAGDQFNELIIEMYDKAVRKARVDVLDLTSKAGLEDPRTICWQDPYDRNERINRYKQYTEALGLQEDTLVTDSLKRILMHGHHDYMQNLWYDLLGEMKNLMGGEFDPGQIRNADGELMPPSIPQDDDLVWMRKPRLSLREYNFT